LKIPFRACHDDVHINMTGLVPFWSEGVIVEKKYLSVDYDNPMFFVVCHDSLRYKKNSIPVGFSVSLNNEDIRIKKITRWAITPLRTLLPVCRTFVK